MAYALRYQRSQIRKIIWFATLYLTLQNHLPQRRCRRKS
jgi:hypothetical protein